jgi:restriction system protein
MTIIDAIKTVINLKKEPITALEAYRDILSKGLYVFHAQKPAHVVLTQIRRHCEGIDFPSAAPTKHFKLIGDNKFTTLKKAKRFKRVKIKFKNNKKGSSTNLNSLVKSLKNIQSLHQLYLQQLKEKVISELRRLSPSSFELFSKELLQVYGFENAQVTSVSGDGGIDGFGRYKVGLAHLNVAFQCKRWTKNNVQRTEIDKFRGAAQGDFEQGVFFATTSFSQGAIDASVKRGAVPIVLVDADAIFNLMIEKGFGIQTENLPIPSYALDLAITREG